MSSELHTVVTSVLEANLQSDIQTQSETAELLLEFLQKKPTTVSSILKEEKKFYKTLDQDVDAIKKCMASLLFHFTVVKAELFKDASDDDLKYVIVHAKNGMTQHPPLAKLCSTLIEKILEQITTDQFPSGVLQHLQKNFSCGWSKLTPEVLPWIVIAAEKKFLDKTFLKKHWGSKHLLAEGELEVCVDLIADNYKSNFNICVRLMQYLWKHEIGKKLLAHLMEESLPDIDDSQFQLLLVTVCLSVVDKCTENNELFELLHVNLLLTVAYYTIDSTSELGKAFTQLVDKIYVYVEQTKGENHIAVVDYFVNVSPVRNPMYAEFTRTLCNKMPKVLATKYVNQLIGKIQTEGPRKAAASGEDTDEDEEEETDSLTAGRRIKLVITQCSNVNKSEVFSFCFKQALKFGHQEESDDNYSAIKSIRSLFEVVSERIYKGVDYQTSANDLVNNIRAVNKSMGDDIPEKQKESWVMLLKQIEDLLKKPVESAENRLHKREVFIYFCVQLSFALLTEAQSIHTQIQDLCDCIQKAYEKRKNIKEVSWDIVLTELMLSLLVSYPGLKAAIQSVFLVLKPALTDDAHQLLIDVIKGEPDAQGRLNADGAESDSEDAEEENEDSAEEDGSSDEEAEDEETGDVEMESDDGDSDEDDEDSDDESDEEEEETNDPTIKKKEQKLLEVLKNVMGDVPDEEDDKAELDDEVMLQMDSKINTAFREQKEIVSQMKQFKDNCLDVISALLRDREGDIHTHLLFLDPLSELSPSSVRAKNVYHHLCSCKKVFVTRAEDYKFMCETLASTLTIDSHKYDSNGTQSRMVKFLVNTVSSKESKKFDKKHPKLKPDIMNAVEKLIEEMSKSKVSIAKDCCKYIRRTQIFASEMFWPAHEKIWVVVLKKGVDIEIKEFLLQTLHTMINSRIKQDLGPKPWKKACQSFIKNCVETMETFNKKLSLVSLCSDVTMRILELSPEMKSELPKNFHKTLRTHMRHGSKKRKLVMLDQVVTGKRDVESGNKRKQTRRGNKRHKKGKHANKQKS